MKHLLGKSKSTRNQGSSLYTDTNSSGASSVESSIVASTPSTPTSPTSYLSCDSMDAKQFPHGVCTITPPALNISPERTLEILKECARGRKLSYAELWMPQHMRGYEFGVPHLVRHELHGCKCNDKEQMNRQKGVTTHLIKSMGSNLLEGKSVINVSLPVRIFEPRSFLQRIADVWAFAPMYLALAAESRDPVERMKWTITWLVAGMHRGTIQLKPFNPILGETMQGTFPDGTRMFCEQVSHHPPITAFQMVGPQAQWEYEGFHECNASFRPNGVLGYQTGPNRMHFKDGTVITFNMPKCKVSGILFGERVVSYTGPLVFHDEKNNLKAEVELNPDGLSGLKSWISSAKTPADTIRGTINRGDKPVSSFEGSWLWSLSFDSKVYWALGQYQPFDPIWPADKDVLPSDSRFRQDLLHLAKGDEETSQREKERLEEEQRYFRKLRSKHSKEKEARACVPKSSSKGLLSSLGSFFSSDKKKSKSNGAINTNEVDSPAPLRASSVAPPSFNRARTVETPPAHLLDDSPEPSPQLRPCELHVDYEAGCPGCSGQNNMPCPNADTSVADDLALANAKKASVRLK